MVERCELTELDKATCSHCREISDPEQEMTAVRRRLLANGWRVASYPGYCASCGEWFNVGAAIHASATAGAGWLAECCAP